MKDEHIILTLVLGMIGFPMLFIPLGFVLHSVGVYCAFLPCWFIWFVIHMELGAKNYGK